MERLARLHRPGCRASRPLTAGRSVAGADDLAAQRSSSVSASASSVTSRAPTFCSSQVTRLVPGMGTTGMSSRSCCALTHARATWAGGTPSRSATRRTVPAMASFASPASPLNRGLRPRKSLAPNEERSTVPVRNPRPSGE